MVEVRSLVKRIQNNVRYEAKNHPVFEKSNGCIRIMITPCTKEADDWLGGLSTFEKHMHAGFGCVSTGDTDIVTYEFTSAIMPGQDYTFEYPSSMSQSTSLVVLEPNGDESTEFAKIQVCISGARNVLDDGALVNQAAIAVIDWFEEPFEVSPVI